MAKGINIIESLNGLHEFEPLIRLAREFGDPLFSHPNMRMINVGKPRNKDDDKRYVFILWKSPLLVAEEEEMSGPRVEGSGGDLLSDSDVSIIKDNVSGDIMHSLAQDQIAWRNGVCDAKLGEDEGCRPGALYISRLMLIKGGTRRQPNHTDCPGLPPDGPYLSDTSLPPCTLVYPLQSNGCRLLFVEDETAQRRKPMCRLIHPGQAFLFAGWKEHAGPILRPDNNVRFRVELDVLGCSWKHKNLGP